FTVGWGINDAGQVVGFSGSVSQNGFLYSSGTYTTIADPLADSYTYAFGINATGLIVGEYFVNGNLSTHGFIFNPSTGTYSTIDRPGGTNTEAHGINNAGQIVGNFDDTVNGKLAIRGYLLSGGLFATIDFGKGTLPRGINNLGQIVGSYFDNNNKSHGFLYN